MASKIKVDEIETVDGSGNITVNQPLSGSGAGLTSLPAGNLTGTIADARFPSTLPAISGENLTGILPAVGSSGNVLTSNGSAWASTAPAGGGGFTVATEQATTSGTSVTFSGISAGVTKVFISFFNVSLNGTDHFKIQLGTSGGIETSGYLSNSHDFGGSGSSIDGIEHYDSFALPIGGAGYTVTGNVILCLEDATNNTWIANGNGGTSSGPNAWLCNGYLNNLHGVLTQIKILPSGSNSFDSGAVNISYM